MDAEAFDRYVTGRYAALVGHVAAMCASRDEAADAVQEALTRAWARRGAFGRHPNKDAWVRTWRCESTQSVGTPRTAPEKSRDPTE